MYSTLARFKNPAIISPTSGSCSAIDYEPTAIDKDQLTATAPRAGHVGQGVVPGQARLWGWFGAGAGTREGACAGKSRAVGRARDKGGSKAGGLVWRGC